MSDIKLGRIYKRKPGHMSYVLANLIYIIPTSRIKYSDLYITYDMHDDSNMELSDFVIDDFFELVTEYE